MTEIDVIAVFGLMTAALSLSGIIGATTRHGLWRLVLSYWICSMIVAGATFGLSALSLVLGWSASTVVLAFVWLTLWLIDNHVKVRRPPPPSLD